MCRLKRATVEPTHLFPDVQGRLTYWHMGKSRKARATVAITANSRKEKETPELTIEQRNISQPITPHMSHVLLKPESTIQQ